jgi:O-antigen/teichoic acid export membrane protein
MDPTHRVAEMLLPALVARRAAGDHQGFDRALADSARYLATGLLLLAAAAGGAAYGVMDLYGEGFSRGADALTLVLLVPVAYCISTLNGQALIAVDRPLVTSMISVVRTVLIIALGAVLAVAIGVTGMALAMLAGWIVDVAWKTLAVRRHIKTPLASLLPPRVAAAPVLAYGAGLGVSRLADSAVGGVPGLLLALTAGGAAFVGTFLLVGGVVERDRERLGALGRRLRGRVAVAVEPTRT